MKWKTVQPSELDQTIKIGPHRWRHAKSFHWEYCFTCGIVAVNNIPTKRLCRKLCGTFWT